MWSVTYFDKFQGKTTLIARESALFNSEDEAVKAAVKGLRMFWKESGQKAKAKITRLDKRGLERSSHTYTLTELELVFH